MKKSLLALAVLGAFAAHASAQSSVTIYGLVDVNLGKDMGNDDKRMGQGAISRLGFRGTEDLGGGLSAFFQFEHRFKAADGTIDSAAGKMWHGSSYVGLKGGFGSVALGRQYTTSFLLSQLRADPWGFDTVAANSAILTGGVGTVRNDSAVTYNFAMGGFSFGAQIADGTANGNGPDHPWNVGLRYAGGPLSAGLAYEKRTFEDSSWLTANVAYDLGMVKLGAFIGDGELLNVERKSWLVSATAPIGGGELRASYGQRKVGGTKDIKQTGLGYFYPLSKRTTVYVDVANNSELNDEKTGYDFGIKHTF